MAYNKFEKIDGFTQYAWVSLVVKSIRMGWPEGIRQAETRLGTFITKRTATVQIFEDILPADVDIPEIDKAIWSGDWDKVCSYNTHHGRNQTDWFIKEWVSGYGDWAGNHEPQVKKLAEEKYGFKRIQSRMCGDFWTWYNIKSKIKETGVREIDRTPWAGIPPDILDMHTIEGKRMKTNVTLLSGTNDGHIKFAQMVQKFGWDGVRKIIHDKKPYKVEGITQFKNPVPKPEPPKPKNVQRTLLVF